METRHKSPRTLIEDLDLAYRAAIAGRWGRWGERLWLWWGLNTTAEEIIQKRAKRDNDDRL